jgi:hypothetical protein
MDRRHFVQTSLAASAASLLPLRAAARLLRSSDSKRILVLGGTTFLGPALVETVSRCSTAASPTPVCSRF